jgi:hypothetical protein
MDQDQLLQYTVLSHIPYLVSLLLSHPPYLTGLLPSHTPYLPGLLLSLVASHSPAHVHVLEHRLPLRVRSRPRAEGQPWDGVDLEVRGRGR